MPTTPNSIITPQTVRTAQAVCTAAKTSYNDGVNAVLLLTAGPNGGVLYGLKAAPRATVTATQCQLFRSPDGAAFFFTNAVTMPAYTMANTTSPTLSDFGYTETNPLRLAPNERLYVGVAVALVGGIVFDAQYEDL